LSSTISARLRRGTAAGTRSDGNCDNEPLKRNAFPLGEQRSGGASFGGNLRQSSEASQSVIHGGAPPAPMSPSDVADVVLLVGIQAVLFTSVIVAFVLSLR